MKKLAGILTLICAFANIGFSQINFENMSLSDAMKKAEKENKKIFIDVYTTWCGPCKVMDTQVFSDKAVGERMSKEYVALKIDYEKGEFRKDVIHYHIDGYPTMLIIDSKGYEIGRIYGKRSLEEFNLELDNYSTKKHSVITQAFMNLNDKSTGEKVWKESLILLEDNINTFLNSDLYHVYLDACEKYYKNFDITTFNGQEDLKIFKNVTLPLEHPVVQLYLKDSTQYARWYLHKDYMTLAFKDEVKKAKKDSDRAEIRKRAEAYYDLFFINLGGDVESKEYFMEDIFGKKNKNETQTTPEEKDKEVIPDEIESGKKKKKKNK